MNQHQRPQPCGLCDHSSGQLDGLSCVYCGGTGLRPPQKETRMAEIIEITHDAPGQYISWKCRCGTHWNSPYPQPATLVCRKCERHYTRKDMILTQIRSRHYRTID